MSVRVLGIDPGLANMGVCVVELDGKDIKVVFLEVLATQKSSKKKEVLASSDTVRRARELANALNAVVVRQRPMVMAVEAMSYPRNASSAAKTAVSWGVLATLAELFDLPMVQASPQDMKKALCGNRSASKVEVQKELESHFPGAFHDFVTRYPKAQHEHGFDALGVVFACLNSEVVRMARGLAR